MKKVLEIHDLNYTYHTPEGETPALRDISFSVKSGEFISIVGPSGCGKSTLLSLISGLLTPGDGTIQLMGKPLKESRTNVGYMLQHDHLFEWRSIYHNVLLGLEIQHKHTNFWKLTVLKSLQTRNLPSFPEGCDSGQPLCAP